MKCSQFGCKNVKYELNQRQILRTRNRREGTIGSGREVTNCMFKDSLVRDGHLLSG